MSQTDGTTVNTWDLVIKDLEDIRFPDLIRQGVKSQLIADFHVRVDSGEWERLFDTHQNNAKNAYEQSLLAILSLRQALEDERTKRIITRTSEGLQHALLDMYRAQIQIALGLRYVLNLEKENHESTTDAGNGRDFEEPSQHQSNIIVP